MGTRDDRRLDPCSDSGALLDVCYEVSDVAKLWESDREVSGPLIPSASAGRDGRAGCWIRELAAGWS